MSPRIPASLKGSGDPLNFYCTNYNSSYGRSELVTDSAQPTGIITHRSTGYQSNLRPAVYYSPNLDQKDNPHMGLILRSNYTSITKRDFNNHQQVTGAEPLPKTLSSLQSGYINNIKVTHPGSRTSPSLMSTEYKTRFTAQTLHHPGSSQSAVIGAMENSGYTEGSNLEPITHHPHSQYHVPRGNHRITGHSMTKTDFLPVPTLKGNEPLPVLAKASERDSAFTRESHQARHTSAPYDGSQPLSNMKHMEEPVGRVYVGRQEPLGFCNNNHIYVKPGKEPPQHYLTNYSLRFRSPTPIGRDEEGWTRGGIQKQRQSGFLANNEAHISGI
ncbi:stabilizer of axonemal microtubules 4 [Pseudophryne corroboree]|uniref:stabilizer of axonemal microtubules 4 n=1 Tax=Pseudophryne corroboree TaxID=495146 RepID=UPI003081ED5C